MKFCFLLPTFLLTLSPLLSHPLSLYLHIGSPFPRLSHRLVHCLLPPPRLAINPRLAFIIPLHFSLPAPLVRSLTTALFTLPLLLLLALASSVPCRPDCRPRLFPSPGHRGEPRLTWSRRVRLEINAKLYASGSKLHANVQLSVPRPTPFLCATFSRLSFATRATKSREIVREKRS